MKYWPWRFALGLAILAGLFAMVDVATIVQLMSTLNAGWVLAAGGLLVTTTLLGACALHQLFRDTLFLPFATFLPKYWTSWAVGLVFPGQVGDMASITVLLQKQGFAASAVLGRTIADKLVSLALMLAFALAAALYYFRSDWLVAAVLGCLMIALVAVLLARRMRTGHRYAGHRYLVFLRQAVREATLVVEAHPGPIALNAVITLCKIVLAGLAYWCMFRAFGASHAPAWGVVCLVAISSLVAYIPVSWNGIGTAEAAGIAIFSAVGVAAPTVLASYLVLRAMGLTLAWIPAGAWLVLSRRRR